MTTRLAAVKSDLLPLQSLTCTTLAGVLVLVPRLHRLKTPLPAPTHPHAGPACGHVRSRNPEILRILGSFEFSAA